MQKKSVRVNIYNFIRMSHTEPTRFIQDDFDTIREQIITVKQYGFPGTYALKHDALMEPRYQELLKRYLDDGDELSAWWEITRELCQRSGVRFRENVPGEEYDDRVDSAYCIGYSPEERKLLVDGYMEDFFSVNDQSEGTGSMVARFLAEHSKAARGDQSWRDAAVYAVAHEEERDVTETFLNRLDNYKTANVKIIRALLGCSEGEAKQILADLVELDLLEELDIEDCYFVVHKEIPNVIGLFKMHVVYVLAMERRNAGKPVFEGEEMERAINELCEDPIDNGKEEEQ